MKYDHELIAQLRSGGRTWSEIAAAVNHPTTKKLRQAHSRWLKRQRHEEVAKIPGDPSGVVVQEWKRGPEGTTHVKYPGAEGVDLGAVYREVFDDLLADFAERTSAAHVERPPIPKITGDPALAEIAIHDPHFGMLAWGREVGEDQDIRTIQEDYLGAVNHLVGLSRLYPVDRYLYIVGHDMGHVNQAGEGGKGGATKKGTQQDLDTRLAKIFTAMRRCAVAGIELAASSGRPVDVVVVPGNHDPDESYRLGEVLKAWYRNDPNITVWNEPRKRKFYNYGRNTFMLTHGEEVRRKRDPLPLIMADECPPEWWVASAGGCREIHTGHNHIRLQGGYYPEAEMTESRGIVTRSLPGLTTVDAWHYEEGYRHRRAATLLMFAQSGGLVGLHEYQPKARTR